MRAGRVGTIKAQKLRKEPTDAEKHLWNGLRRLPGDWHFRRQHPIAPYTVDFASLAARLVIEADGGQHDESASDVRRDRFLRAKGWRVLRFRNNEILTNREGVLETILVVLSESPTLERNAFDAPLSAPPRKRGAAGGGASESKQKRL